MNESGLKNMEKLEGGRPWKKCIWQSNRLETGEHLLEEGMQGIAIVVVMKGVIQFLPKSGGEPFWLQEREVCLISFAPPYKVKVQEDAHLLICMFHLDIFPFDRDMLGALLPFYHKEEKDHVVLQANELIVSFAGLMEEYIQKGVKSDLLFDIKRQEFFLLFFATYSRQELASFFYPLIGEDVQFKEFVVSNYIKAKNVQQLAQMANYSTSGFIKKFMKYFNESPYQWMLRQKAKLILDEICSSQIALKEIAFKYNFSSYQHFMEFCKMQFGVTPSQLQGGKRETE